MKFLFVLAQLRAAVVREYKHEAKCTLRVVWHLLLFCLLLLIENLRLCSSAEVGIVLKF